MDEQLTHFGCESTQLFEGFEMNWRGDGRDWVNYASLGWL